ncbi:metal-dependent transcriptional regulator [Aerococcaceae bacterium NML191292]|nr:metal-dependent transcriptional regulator [Aerococcaceae bacterium NML210727]MCW6654152.1 metal-dependent transcriptional regulator [Aerococcaceae bacterium NML201296]MCW6659807.1 metal-dependent transcriptional regulator [Aerococcaceae bacterium NML191292]MCW6661775.1 metal-dependent transcriptional regulator [Aerococcaceae bacterium NML201209]MCW6663659.1 metal-dependent transcriptional regulator [Aerococcaceae bacterium NML190073]MCW6665921.1 metal-dependent transcriptional regulator [Ae
MSQSREDYIKFMYEEGHGLVVSNKQIAEGLNIAPPSVSEMMTKLEAEGLITYRRYHGALLTESGIAMAEELIRKHEIWEYFLEHKLKYTKEEVHELAEILEHATPTDLANRLAAYIDFPTVRKDV